MMKKLRNFVLLMWLKIKIIVNLAAENIALRQQLAAMKRTNKRPKILMIDRLFWVVLSRIWTAWRESLVIVTPDTVIRWHRKGFKLFWTFKSKGAGRPRVDREIRKLVRKMAKANPSWGAPRIQGELLRLGFDVSERTVSNLMPRRPPNAKPSQTWRTFLNNHVNKCSIDFFTVPTVAFNILFVLVILEVISAPQKPWQNPFIERIIGSIRRECTDHVIVLNEGQLRSVLSSYFEYYHNDRTHLSLGKDTPKGRPIQRRPAGKCKIIDLPRIGGPHHRYEWKKAA
jgi:hypothetical protein